MGLIRDSNDGGAHYVGYYELLVQRGGYSFEDEGVPLGTPLDFLEL